MVETRVHSIRANKNDMNKISVYLFNTNNTWVKLISTIANAIEMVYNPPMKEGFKCAIVEFHKDKIHNSSLIKDRMLKEEKQKKSELGKAIDEWFDDEKKGLTYGDLGTITIKNNKDQITAKLFVLPSGNLAEDSWLENKGHPKDNEAYFPAEDCRKCKANCFGQPKFCPWCGIEDPVDIPSLSKFIICPKCGVHYIKYYKYCEMCGEPNL